MAQKIKLTRPELKRQRDALARFERYLPMLKLKQQQLQLMVRQVQEKLVDAQHALLVARDTFEPYRPILADRAGVNVHELAEPVDVVTADQNIAGVVIPVLEDLTFPKPEYSLFASPPWVDAAVRDLRELARRREEVHIVQKQLDLLQGELLKIIQRVNLFEKVKIPDSREAIRRIRIRLGDEMTAGVGRAKIAKSKLTRTGGHSVYGGSEVDEEQDESITPGKAGPA